MSPIRLLVEAFLHVDLRRTFHQVCWLGEWPPSLPDGPVIAYSNHHNFYDGHLAWLLFQATLDRSPTLWMAEWDRLPFFAAVGAQPFPPDDSGRRAATMRRTARRFRTNPRTVLVYYPEGTLHAPEEGLRSFDPSTPQRLGTLYPDASWWPYSVHVTWRDEPNPTALLTGGEPHDPDGQERLRLRRLLQILRSPNRNASKILLSGTGSLKQWSDLSFASSFFQRYL